MQGFGMGRYRPADQDPRKESFNSRAGRHPLGRRARKLDQGVLVVRFELPFNIWCDSCQNHIGQGVRYNAEKKQIGSYYTTPVWSFRCKCHLCQNWFEIRTDPQNTRYIVVSGARQQIREPDSELDAAGPSATQTRGDVSLAGDAFAQLEKRKADEASHADRQSRIDELYEASAAQWADPFERNKAMRKTFREQKKARLDREERDAVLRQRIGWADDRLLAGETTQDPEMSTPTVRRDFLEARAARRQSERLGSTNDVRRTKRPNRTALPGANATAEALAQRILGNRDSRRTSRRRNV